MFNSSSFGALDPVQTPSIPGPQHTCAGLFWGPRDTWHHSGNPVQSTHLSSGLVVPLLAISEAL